MKRPLIVAILIACAAVPAAAQNKGKRGFVWDDRPTIVFGEDDNNAVTGRALIEWRWFDPDIGEDLFALRAGRIGLKGDLTRHIDWEVEREIGAGDAASANRISANVDTRVMRFGLRASAKPRRRPLPPTVDTTDSAV